MKCPPAVCSHQNSCWMGCLDFLLELGPAWADSCGQRQYTSDVHFHSCYSASIFIRHVRKRSAGVESEVQFAKKGLFFSQFVQLRRIQRKFHFFYSNKCEVKTNADNKIKVSLKEDSLCSICFISSVSMEQTPA